MIFRILICIIFFASSVFADTLIFKNGKKSENVKTLVREKDVVVEFEDGHQEVIPKDWLEFLKKQEVEWNRPVAPPARVKPSPQEKEEKEGSVDFTEAKSTSFDEEYSKVDAEIKKDEEERRLLRVKKFENEITEIKNELQKEEAAAAKPEPWSKSNAVKRSAVFPGWGQKYSGYDKKAYLFGGGFIASALLFYSSWNRYQKAESEYKDTAIPAALLVLPSEPIAGYFANQAYFDNKKSHLSDTTMQFNLSFILFAGIYAWNLYDITHTESPFQVKLYRTKESNFLYANNPDSRWNFEFNYTFRF